MSDRLLLLKLSSTVTVVHTVVCHTDSPLLLKLSSTVIVHTVVCRTDTFIAQTVLSCSLTVVHTAVVC